MKKRILGLALVAILVLNLLPMCVSAATAGYCGKNVTWTFNEKTGVLVISGTGAMDDYDYSVGSIPWYVLGKNIKSIIVNNGITHIGNEAFWSSAVESVTLPSSLESIGWGAFENCDKLKKVIIPEGVKKIEECTFRSCRSLETVIIPNSVTEIGEKAFEHSGITNITIPNRVTYIGQYAFGSCKKLKSLVLPDNVQLGVNVFSDSTMLEVKSDKIQTVYAADGRHANVKKTEVANYLEQGWYLEPVQTLYAIGKSALFKKSEVAAQLTVGWYEEPVVYMYAMDGRRRVAKKSEIEAYEKVNWYYGKPVKMYALDGRTKWVGENRVKENEKVNWYYGKPTKMYAPDGRVITIGENRVAEYKKVGWYTEPVTTMYSVSNGEKRTKHVVNSEVSKHLNSGWRKDSPKSKVIYVNCEDCSGTGKRKCSRCNGSGTERRFAGFYEYDGINRIDFGNLDGKPKYERVICSLCSGTGKRTCLFCPNASGKVTKTVYYY